MDRAKVMLEMARAIRKHMKRLAEIESRENGTPASQTPAGLETAARYFEFYAGLVNVNHGETLNVGAGYHAYTRREPFGVVGIITPWNVPLNQAARASAPALAAGNTVVVKPSEETSATTVEFARIVTEECGLPPGVFNVVLGAGRSTGSALVSHPLVRKVAFTGSLRAGKEIGHIAADRILPLTLELGGKSPHIVFEDADLDKAAANAANIFTRVCGQICSSGTRLLVQDSIHDAFVAKLVKEVAEDQRRAGGGRFGRSSGHESAVRKSPELLPARQTGRRESGHWRRAPARREAQERLVRHSDGLHRREQRHAHLARGDLRPGDGRDPF